jgi:hypothetical protein
MRLPRGREHRDPRNEPEEREQRERDQSRRVSRPI